jgi:hypothetical protein
MHYYIRYGFTTKLETEQGYPCTDPICRHCGLYASTRTSLTYHQGDNHGYTLFFYLIGTWREEIKEYAKGDHLDAEGRRWVPVCERCFDDYDMDDETEISLYLGEEFVKADSQSKEIMSW